MTKFDYKEPEFKVVISASEDVITTSADLEIVKEDWDTGSSGNSEEIGFTL